MEDHPCSNCENLHRRKRQIIEELEATLNTLIPSRTRQESDEEYYHQNKDKKKQYHEQSRDK